MRKPLLLALVAAVAIPAIAPVAASAQTRELRRDRQDIREERRDLDRAYRYGDRRDIRDAERDLYRAKREYREDLRDYRRDAWRDYRRDNRRLYSRGSWRSPYAYRSFHPGARLGPGYYAPRYVIAEPWRYHLPRAGRYQRWVRHYDDVLLINVRSGRVVDVIRGFYW